MIDLMDRVRMPRGAAVRSDPEPPAAALQTPPDRAPARNRTGINSDRRLRASDLALALAVAAGAIAIGWLYRSAIVPIDPWDYVEGARNFPNGVWHPEGLSRWGIMGPTILFARAWGNSEATYYALPILSSGALGATLFLIGTRLASRWVGAIAALVILTAPVISVHATRGYPDLIATALVALSVLLLIWAGDLARSPTGAPLRRTPAATALLLVAAGLVCGWAFETRETTVFAWPALGLLLLRVGSPLRRAWWFALPALAVFALDMFLSARYYGDPLLKLHVAAGADITTSVVEADIKYVGHDRWWYATAPLRVLGNRTGGPVLLAALALGLAGGAVLWRRLWPVWAWGTSTFLLLWAQGGALRPEHPSVRLDIARYSMSYVVPLVLTCVLVLAALVSDQRNWIRRSAVATSIAMATAGVLAVVSFASQFPGFAANGGAPLTALRTVMPAQAQVADSVVWSDWATQRLIPVYQFDEFGDRLWRAGHFRSLNRLIDRPTVQVDRWPTAGDFVIVHSPTDDTCYYCRKASERVAKFYGALPLSGWQALYRSSTGNLAVYRLPEGYVWPHNPTLSLPRP